MASASTTRFATESPEKTSRMPSTGTAWSSPMLMEVISFSVLSSRESVAGVLTAPGLGAVATRVEGPLYWKNIGVLRLRFGRHGARTSAQDDNCTFFARNFETRNYPLIPSPQNRGFTPPLPMARRHLR